VKIPPQSEFKEKNNWNFISQLYKEDSDPDSYFMGGTFGMSHFKINPNSLIGHVHEEILVFENNIISNVSVFDAFELNV
jgi:hypothetical protein